MRLISVDSARRNNVGSIDLVLTADLEDGQGEQVFPFTWSPDDPHGLAPAVTDFMTANPGFPIGDAPPAALVAKQVISQADVDAKATELSIAQPMRIK